MQRTQSAPAFGTSTPSFAQQSAPIKRIKTNLDFLVTSQPASPSPTSLYRSPTSAKSDREDAFSLGGFFPSSSREQEFDWVRYGVEGQDAIMEHNDLEVIDEDIERAPPGMLIRAEDKLGVLSVFDIPSISSSRPPEIYHDENERLYSPYTEDVSCNEESLHLAYAQRSRSRSTPQNLADVPVAPGPLFLGPSDQDGVRINRWGLSALAGVF